jgi:hypothetical protein
LVATLADVLFAAFGVFVLLVLGVVRVVKITNWVASKAPVEMEEDWFGPLLGAD